MTISILIPFRPDGSPERQRNFDWCVARWRAWLPDAELVIGDVGGERMSRAASRNEAFERSSGEVIILGDADTVATHVRQIITALNSLNGRRVWIFPFRRYALSTKIGAETICSQDPSAELDRLRMTGCVEGYFTSPTSGIWIMQREAWMAAGGFEESFGERWSFDDDWWRDCLNARWGKMERVDGDVIHLWHEPSHPLNRMLKSPDSLENRAIYDQLKAKLRAAG